MGERPSALEAPGIAGGKAAGHASKPLGVTPPPSAAPISAMPSAS